MRAIPKVHRIGVGPSQCPPRPRPFILGSSPEGVRWAQLLPDPQPVVLKKIAMEGVGGTQPPTRPRPLISGNRPSWGFLYVTRIFIYS